MNWRIETEIDYFIVIKPSQAIETSQIFREKGLKQDTLHTYIDLTSIIKFL